jgi:putative aminopeptidase FrvX
MNKNQEEFFREIKKLVSRIEALVDKYGMEDRFICAAMYGLIDDMDDDDDENVNVGASYHFSVQDEVELQAVSMMMHKAYTAMTGNDKLRGIFNSDTSLN